MGATFDPVLAEEWGTAMGLEFWGKGSNIQEGPGEGVLHALSEAPGLQGLDLAPGRVENLPADVLAAQASTSRASQKTVGPSSVSARHSLH